MTPPLPFPHVVCWNGDTRQQVISAEALRVRESVFHATHFPSPILALNPQTNPPTAVAYSERKFAGDFQRAGVERIFCVVKGDSGTGKSHLIRWLWREIENEAKQDYKIVRVPRHAANLAAVLNYILAEDFHGEEVERIRQELKQTADLTPTGAMQRVLDELAFVLDPHNRERSRLQFPDDVEHQEIILPLLPAMLRDSAIRKHFTGEGSCGVVERLAHHVIGTRDRRSDPALLRWTEQNLAIPAAAFARAGADAKDLASTLLHDKQLRELTAGVLNRAFEDAGPALVGLKHGNLGEAMLEIRRQLKNVGRELLLFIEDLSVSQGMDAELIESLLVTPAPGDGGPDLCVLRSVVGVTNDDFQQMLDNIRGRIDLAVAFDMPLAEHKVEGFSDGEIADFTSRYLNAARYTLGGLDEWYKETRGKSELGSFCVESACPNRTECHARFGAVDDRGLYPFNPTAVARLYRNLHRGQNCGEERAFNPRLLVSGVFKYMLEEAETQIPGQGFPATNFLEWFKLAEVAPEVQVELREKHGEYDAGRIRTALEMYAESPNTGLLPDGLPETFGLQHEGVTGKVKLPETLPGHEVDKPPVPPPQADNVFSLWLNRGQLEDRNLNEWRIAVFRAMRGSRDWDSDPLQSCFLKHFNQRFIHFDGQHTSRAGDVQLVIKRTPENAEALRQLVTDSGSRRGLLLAMQLVEEWTEEVCNKLRKLSRVSGQPKPLTSAVNLLSIGALLRGAVPEECDPQGFLAALLSPWPEKPARVTERSASWNQLQEAFQRWGPKLREWLLRQIGGAKGGQIGAGMIDVALVIDDVQAAARRVQTDFGDDFGTKWDEGFYEPVIELGRRVAKFLPPAIEQEVGYCRQWLTLLEGACGGNTTRQLGTQLQSAIQAGIRAPIFDKGRASDLPPRCEVFINGQVEQSAQLARSVTAVDVARNKQLRLLAQVNRAGMDEAAETLRLAEMELTAANEYLDRQFSGGMDQLDQLEQSTRAALGNLRQKLETVLGDTEDNVAV
ncbi:MAG: hypothetical protein J0M04_19910 [Verrucomicrobia bacterium]|nr:hypothetical protein [Verrucomicrobiota bacterium]